MNKFLLPLAAFIVTTFLALPASAGEWLCCEKIHCERASTPEAKAACEKIPHGPVIIGGIRRTCGVANADKSKAIASYNDSCHANGSNTDFNCWMQRVCRQQ